MVCALACTPQAPPRVAKTDRKKGVRKEGAHVATGRGRGFNRASNGKQRQRRWPDSAGAHLDHGGGHLHGLGRPSDGHSRRIAALIYLNLSSRELLQRLDRLSVLANHPENHAHTSAVGTFYSPSSEATPDRNCLLGSVQPLRP